MDYINIMIFINKEYREEELNYTTDQIRSFIDEYKEYYGIYPHRLAGEIKGQDITWKQLNDFIARFNFKDKPKGWYKSLDNFIDKKYRYIKKVEKTPYIPKEDISEGKLENTSNYDHSKYKPIVEKTSFFDKLKLDTSKAGYRYFYKIYLSNKDNNSTRENTMSNIEEKIDVYIMNLGISCFSTPDIYYSPS